MKQHQSILPTANNVLFDEWGVGALRAKNRFVRAATWEGLATNEGRPTPELLAVYEELAAGGVGTIITGYAHVTRDEQPNPCMLGIYDDAFISEYQALVHAVHAHDARIVLQVAYGGSASRLDPPSKRILGPSAVANPKTSIVPVEATQTDLHDLMKAFASAVRRARKAGFDGVELHAAHGYLLSQFLSPLLNRRTDEYGGSLEKRTRFVAETVQAARREAGDSFPLLVKLNSSDGVEGGLESEESLQVARTLAECGADAIEVSGDWHAYSVADCNGQPFFGGYAAQLAQEVSVPVILTGGNRRFDIMEHFANKKGIAAFGMCRPFICEPDLVNRWQRNAEATPRCISCNGCNTTPGHRCVL